MAKPVNPLKLITGILETLHKKEILSSEEVKAIIENATEKEKEKE